MANYKFAQNINERPNAALDRLIRAQMQQFLVNGAERAEKTHTIQSPNPFGPATTQQIHHNWTSKKKKYI